jgi:hypothetical protein
MMMWQQVQEHGAGGAGDMSESSSWSRMEKLSSLRRAAAGAGRRSCRGRRSWSCRVRKLTAKVSVVLRSLHQTLSVVLRSACCRSTGPARFLGAFARAPLRRCYFAPLLCLDV